MACPQEDFDPNRTDPNRTDPSSIDLVADDRRDDDPAGYAMRTGAPVTGAVALAGAADLSHVVVTHQALGVVMNRLGVDEAVAEDLIHHWASDHGQDLVDFCTSLLAPMGTTESSGRTDPSEDETVAESSVDHNAPLAGPVLDGLAEALVLAGDPASRAGVVLATIQELQQVMSELVTTELLEHDGAVVDELVSLQLVVLEADRHARRMVALAPSLGAQKLAGHTGSGRE